MNVKRRIPRVFIRVYAISVGFHAVYNAWNDWVFGFDDAFGVLFSASFYHHRVVLSFVWGRLRQTPRQHLEVVLLYFRFVSSDFWLFQAG
jgi:hypothetical protein